MLYIRDINIPYIQARTVLIISSTTIICKIKNKITGDLTMNLRELELLADKHNVKDTILIVAMNL